MYLSPLCAAGGAQTWPLSHRPPRPFPPATARSDCESRRLGSPCNKSKAFGFKCSTAAAPDTVRAGEAATEGPRAPNLGTNLPVPPAPNPSPRQEQLGMWLSCSAEVVGIGINPPINV